MSNYDITQWTDFVRGVTDAEDEQAMRESLPSAGAREQKMEQLLRRVAEVGRWDTQNAVPEGTVRIVKSFGSLLARRTAAIRKPFQILFDSFAQPALAGVRGGSAEARHLVVESDRHTVDVRHDPGHRSPSGSLHAGAVNGQLFSSQGSQPVPQIPVLVLAGDDVVGTSWTGETGDFQADGLPEGPLNLCVLIGSEECIEFPLSAA